MKYLVTAISFLAIAACAPAQSAEQIPASASKTLVETTGPQVPYQVARSDGYEEMIIAGGCFWCVESDFEKLTGVIEAVSGYTGGTVDTPNYKQVSYTETGHYEAVKVIYDPAVVSYRKLIDHYWKTIDPTDASGQFCDKGSSYRTAIFVQPSQKADAQASLNQVEANKPFEAAIVTPILPAVKFYDAEERHQNYYKKHSLKYKYYRNGCGRDKRLKKLWGGS